MDGNKDEGFWRTHLAAIERAGITTREYAEREGLAVASLYYWRKRLKDQAQRRALAVAPATKPRFVAVELVGGGQQQTSIGLPCTLVMGEALRLQMQALPDPRWLAAVGAAFAARGA